MKKVNWIGLLLICLPGLAWSMPYGDMYVFGDSFSDSGNAFIATGGTDPDPVLYPQHRFTNSLNYADMMAAEMGLALNPSLMPGGTNYAVGGARTSYGAGNMTEQLGLFTLQNGPVADADALYVLWGGGNNIRDMLLHLAVTDVVQTADDLQAMAIMLHDMGAEHILLPNLPSLGLTPEVVALGGGAQLIADVYTQQFNQELAQNIDELALMGIDVMTVDVYALVNDMVFNPGDYGLLNTDTACLLDGPLLCNPDTYLFWDTIHPTSAGHAALASAFLAEEPEPETLAIFLLGLAGMRFVGRRARA